MVLFVRLDTWSNHNRPIWHWNALDTERMQDSSVEVIQNWRMPLQWMALLYAIMGVKFTCTRKEDVLRHWFSLSLNWQSRCILHDAIGTWLYHVSKTCKGLHQRDIRLVSGSIRGNCAIETGWRHVFALITMTSQVHITFPHSQWGWSHPNTTTMACNTYSNKVGKWTLLQDHETWSRESSIIWEMPHETKTSNAH